MRRTLMAALAGLVMTGTLLVSAPAQADYQPWGNTSARDQKLQPGCHKYPYTYRVTVPTNLWSTEIFLIGPRGGKVGSGYFISGSDAKAGKSAWRLCKASLVPGKYTMRMKVSYIDGYDLLTASVKPTSFRISRR